MMSMKGYVVCFFLVGVMVSTVSRAASVPIKNGSVQQADADAAIKKIIASTSYYRNTYADPFASAGDPEFYIYEIIAKDPRPTQHVDFLQINRKTGEIWVVRGVDCYRYPIPDGPNAEPVVPQPGIVLPQDCR